MKTILLVALLLPCIAFSQYKLGINHLAYNRNAGANELKLLTYENLRLYPIIARDSFKLAFKNLGNFTPLKQALEQKKIVITEMGNGGTVNSVIVQNLSKDTIIINCGEVIKGGQQDRVINEDMVLYPGTGKKDLSVFCVEHGRWSPRSDGLEVSRGNNYDAKSFSGYFNYSSPSLRKVVSKDSNQAVVWNKVSEINSANKTITGTQTYTALDQSGEYNTKMKNYISFFTPRVKAEKDIVGVIVVTGDKVIGADIFASHDLFIQNLDALLHSYATEAIISGKPVTIGQAAVDKYVNDLLSDEKKQEETLKKKGSKFTNNGKKLRISAFE